MSDINIRREVGYRGTRSECCMSCAHKRSFIKDVYVCEKYNFECDPIDICDGYEMSEDMKRFCED